jgi:hypothetical protein
MGCNPRALIVKILWARHGRNVANLSGTFSYRVFDGGLTESGQRASLRAALPGLARAAVELLSWPPAGPR